MKDKMIAAVLLCCVLLPVYTGKAQTAITDSIRSVIFSAPAQPKKLAAILDYCDQYQSLNRDTAYNYALLAVEMSNLQKDERSQARAALALANAYYLWGWVDSAKAVCDTALQKCNPGNANTRDVYFKLLRQTAVCYGGVQQYPEAFEWLYKLLRQAQQYKDSVTIATTLNTIGSLKINLDKPDESLPSIFEALKYDTKDARFLAPKAAILTNAANAYLKKNVPDSALFYINKALPLCRQAQNLNVLAVALRIRSNAYVDLHKYHVAETDLREMISIRQKLSGNSNLTDDNIQIANFYANTGQLNKAIDFCLQHIKNGNIYETGDSVSYNNHLSNKLEFYKALAGFYKQAGMKEAYTDVLEDIINAKDSFYADNSARSIAEIQTKYETEQKEKTILQQKYDLTKKNVILFGSLALVVMAGIISYLLFREYKRKQAIKLALAMEREKAAKQIAVKEAGENERKRIAADLHDNLGVQANAILYNAELLKTENPNSAVLADKLHNTAKQMLFNLRETLWAMKTADIAAENLWLRIISFSKQISRHYTEIQFTTNGAAPAELQLPAAAALNVVMIIQESVQNAIKHSQASKITISSVAGNNSWQVMVHDNGKGFVFKKAFAKPDSHGLKNMQERAAASRLALKFTGSEGSGTVVQVDIPMPGAVSPSV